VTTRFHLRSPDEDFVTRDVVDGRWAEAAGEADDAFGDGLWALPGLVDAHAHLSAETLNYEPGSPEGAAMRAKQALAAGVTLIFDKGWSDASTVEMIDDVPEEERPEIEAAAQLLAVKDGHIPGFANEIDPEAIGPAVLLASAKGRGWVKLAGDWPRKGRGPVTNFSYQQLATAVEAAASVGARIAIHTMAREAPSAAVAAGVHSIEHGLFLNEDDLVSLGARGGMWVPTVLRIEAIVEQLGADSSGGKLLVEGLANIRNLLPKAQEAGVQVLAGTDLVGVPADVAQEAMRLRDYGLSDAQVVRAVSTSGFVATDRPHNFEVGSSADVIFFDSDPYADAAILSHPTRVVRLGISR
jgi:imidazolonepropionase-like amidohydrolase